MRIQYARAEKDQESKTSMLAGECFVTAAGQLLMLSSFAVCSVVSGNESAGGHSPARVPIA